MSSKRTLRCKQTEHERLGGNLEHPKHIPAAKIKAGLSRKNVVVKKQNQSQAFNIET
jgi:hypothetical protein